MCDTTLTDHPALNRRFVRLQAVLHLYAFYVCKQANYAWALDQIQDGFMLDVFADSPADKTQLAQESQQALALFAAHITPPGMPLTGAELPNNHVRTVVAQVLANYTSEQAKDKHRLEGGLATAIAKINQACVRIWQLLAEWAHLAGQQTERPKLRQQHAKAAAAIAHSQILQHLQNSDALAKLVQQETAGWTAHRALVERWYSQFVKQCPTIQRYPAHPMTPHQEQQLLVFLVEDVIFKKSSIQDFFSDVDLKWSIHKRIVKKQVHRGLANFMQKGENSASLQILDLAADGKQGQHFYTDLVQKTLQQDVALEALIAEKAKNWSIDRIFLLDKTIIKLALCEMLHFADIPIKVSINEYIDLSKMYSMPKSSQFVNGLLDAVAATLCQKGSDQA